MDKRLLILVGLFALMFLASCEAETVQEIERPFIESPDGDDAEPEDVREKTKK